MQIDVPEFPDLSDLRRDRLLLGWVGGLHQQNPPLSNSTREQYIYKVRCLLENLTAAGHPLQPSLILAEDFPPRPGRKRIRLQLSNLVFGAIFQSHIQILATTLLPSTTPLYPTTARCFR